MARRQILSLSERESLLALPDDELTLTRMAYFSEHDLALISAHRKPASRFGFAVLLCYLKNVGFAPDKKIPPSDALLKHIASRLKLTGDLWPAYLSGRETTRREHLTERSALTGRASRLSRSDGVHALSSVLYSAACIFRAPQNCSSPSMTAGIRSSKNSATASLPGPDSALSACSPAGPLRWAFVVFAVRHPVAPTPAFSARAVSQRPAAPAVLKPPSNGYRSRAISSPTATGNTSPLPCPICCGPSSTATGLCSVPCSVPPPGPCYGGPANRAWRSVFSAPCIRTADSSTSIRTFTSPSPAAASILNTAYGETFSLKSTPWRKSGAGRSPACCATAIT